MIRWTSCILVMLAITGPVYCQKSAAAGKQAGSWFSNTHDSALSGARLKSLQDSYLKRTTALSTADVEVWQAAANKATLETTFEGLLFTLPSFNPLFDSKDQVVAGAVVKYAKRLEQIPAKAIKEWESLAGGEQITAAMSLTAENRVFPGEKFSDQAFRAFVAKFK